MSGNQKENQAQAGGERAALKAGVVIDEATRLTLDATAEAERIKGGSYMNH